MGARSLALSGLSILIGLFLVNELAGAPAPSMGYVAVRVAVIPFAVVVYGGALVMVCWRSRPDPKSLLLVTTCLVAALGLLLFQWMYAYPLLRLPG